MNNRYRDSYSEYTYPICICGARKCMINVGYEAVANKRLYQEVLAIYELTTFMLVLIFVLGALKAIKFMPPPKVTFQKLE